jgi:hypothetical protein
MTATTTHTENTNTDTNINPKAVDLLVEALAELANFAQEFGCVCPACGEPQPLAEEAYRFAALEMDTRWGVAEEATEAVLSGGRRKLRQLAKKGLAEGHIFYLELLQTMAEHRQAVQLPLFPDIEDQSEG